MRNEISSSKETRKKLLVAFSSQGLLSVPEKLQSTDTYTAGRFKSPLLPPSAARNGGKARAPRAPARGLLPLATPLSRLLNRPAYTVKAVV